MGVELNLVSSTLLVPGVVLSYLCVIPSVPSEGRARRGRGTHTVPTIHTVHAVDAGWPGEEGADRGHWGLRDRPRAIERPVELLGGCPRSARRRVGQDPPGLEEWVHGAAGLSAGGADCTATVRGTQVLAGATVAGSPRCTPEGRGSGAVVGCGRNAPKTLGVGRAVPSATPIPPLRVLRVLCVLHGRPVGRCSHCAARAWLHRHRRQLETAGDKS